MSAGHPEAAGVPLGTTAEPAAEVTLGLAEMIEVMPVLVQSETVEPQLVTVIKVVEKIVTVSPSSATEVAALVVTGLTVVPGAELAGELTAELAEPTGREAITELAADEADETAEETEGATEATEEATDETLLETTDEGTPPVGTALVIERVVLAAAEVGLVALATELVGAAELLVATLGHERSYLGVSPDWRTAKLGVAESWRMYHQVGMLRLSKSQATDFQ